MGISILSYFTVSYLKKSRFIIAVIIGLLMFILVMIKPAFIYIVAIYIVFWIIRFFTHKKEWKYNIIGVASIIVTIIIKYLKSLQI